jgi:hypothetical protein
MKESKGLILRSRKRSFKERMKEWKADERMKSGWKKAIDHQRLKMIISWKKKKVDETNDKSEKDELDRLRQEKSEWK